MKRLLAFGFLLLASAATSKAEGSYCGEIIDHGEPSGYRVVGFDGATNTASCSSTAGPARCVTSRCWWRSA